VVNHPTISIIFHQSICTEQDLHHHHQEIHSLPAAAVSPMYPDQPHFSAPTLNFVLNHGGGGGGGGEDAEDNDDARSIKIITPCEVWWKRKKRISSQGRR